MYEKESKLNSMTLLTAVLHVLPLYVHIMGFNSLWPASASMPLQTRRGLMYWG